MRRIGPLGLMLLVVACSRGDKGASGRPPETSTGPGAAGLLACQSAVRASDAIVACAKSEDEKLVADHVAEMSRKLLTDAAPFAHPAAATLTAQMCVERLDAYERELQARKCAFTASKEERGWIEAQQRHRTPVPAEAKGADHDALANVAAHRDRACACKTAACARDVGDALEKDLTPLSAGASPALRDAASAMIDEIGRCTRRVEMDEGSAKPNEPGDPATIHALAEQIRAERAEAAAKANRPPPPPVTLPDGKKLSLADCAKLPNEDHHDACMSLFDDVVGCQEQSDDVVQCIDDAVKEYLEWISADSGAGFADEPEDE
jgi:hypothetical protein